MSRKRIVPFQLTVSPTVLTGVTATASSDVLTKTTHGLETGDPFIPTGFSGAAGLTMGQRYYAIKVSSSTFKAALTLALAVAGTAVDISSDGTGGVVASSVQLSTTPVIAHSLMVFPSPDTNSWAGNSATAYIGGRNTSGRPDPRTPLTIANGALPHLEEYDLTELWVLCQSGDTVDLLGFNAQPFLRS